MLMACPMYSRSLHDLLQAFAVESVRDIENV